MATLKQIGLCYVYLHFFSKYIYLSTCIFHFKHLVGFLFLWFDDTILWHKRCVAYIRADCPTKCDFPAPVMWGTSETGGMNPYKLVCCIGIQQLFLLQTSLTIGIWKALMNIHSTALDILPNKIKKLGLHLRNPFSCKQNGYSQMKWTLKDPGKTRQNLMLNIGNMLPHTPQHWLSPLLTKKHDLYFRPEKSCDDCD